MLVPSGFTISPCWALVGPSRRSPRGVVKLTWSYLSARRLSLRVTQEPESNLMQDLEIFCGEKSCSWSRPLENDINELHTYSSYHHLHKSRIHPLYEQTLAPATTATDSVYYQTGGKLPPSLSLSSHTSL